MIFLNFLHRIKKPLLSSIQNPDMDDEIILLSAEEYIGEIGEVFGRYKKGNN